MVVDAAARTSATGLSAFVSNAVSLGNGCMMSHSTSRKGSGRGGASTASDGLPRGVLAASDTADDSAEGVNGSEESGNDAPLSTGADDPSTDPSVTWGISVDKAGFALLRRAGTLHSRCRVKKGGRCYTRSGGDAGVPNGGGR
jgi:hypothetical protein